MKRLFAIFVLGLALVLAQAGNVYAAPNATFTVNQTADLVDANIGDGRCDTNLAAAGDQCSLRAAIQQANATAGTDTITFVSSAAHKITRAGNDNTALNGDLDINGSVTLVGRSPATTIDGNGIDRVFHIRSGTVTMSNLIVRGGHTNGFGGGFLIESFTLVSLTNVTVTVNFAADNSGGIENFGALALDRVSIEANTTNDSIGGLGSGRNINSTASLSIRDSTLANNFAADAEIENSASVVNSTIDQLVSEGAVSLRNVTATELRICDGGGGCGTAGTTSLFNSILGACNGTFNSLGYNLIETTTNCALTGNLAGNLLNVSAGLGTLQNNGGPTKTRSLLRGSPAIDAGNPSGCLDEDGFVITTDQRGFPRPTDGNGIGGAQCDIGAFEVGAVGIGAISPNKGSSQPGALQLFDVAWDSPTRWRDLQMVDLRFKRGKEIILWLRFTEGLPNSTYPILDKNGSVLDSGNAGDAKILKNKFGALDLSQSGFTASGPNDPHVVLHYAVKFKKTAAGKLKMQMLATDDFANEQGPEPGGKWKVKQ